MTARQGLVRGPRRSKDDLRVEAFGTVDEANSAVGLARLSSSSMPKLDSLMARLQNDLFDLGSDLATPGEDKDAEPASLRITAAQTAWLEQQIDHFNEGLQPLTSFCASRAARRWPRRCIWRGPLSGAPSASS